MPTYSLLVTTPLLDGTQAPEPPLPFDAADDLAAIGVGEAEAERRMATGRVDLHRCARTRRRKHDLPANREATSL